MIKGKNFQHFLSFNLLLPQLNRHLNNKARIQLDQNQKITHINSKNIFEMMTIIYFSFVITQFSFIPKNSYHSPRSLRQNNYYYNIIDRNNKLFSSSF